MKININDCLLIGQEVKNNGKKKPDFAVFAVTENGNRFLRLAEYMRTSSTNYENILVIHEKSDSVFRLADIVKAAGIVNAKTIKA